MNHLMGNALSPQTSALAAMAQIVELKGMGQSLWLDNIDRRMLVGDGLMQLIESGVSGVTSNPTIFQKALAASDAYDDEIRSLLDTTPRMPAEALYESLTVRDVQMAADLLQPIHTKSDGQDGYVSLEVPPHLAYNTEASLAAARHLWESVSRPNLMIKIPATNTGLTVMERLIGDGINVNATLLFSVKRYAAVAEAYLAGLAHCQDPERVTSVASFFVSRIDSKLDLLLEAIGTPDALALRGQAGIAMARLAYRHFTQEVKPRLTQMPSQARLQRLLWASTSTKNAAYSDVMYVESLIGPDTVTTVPPETLDAFVSHGTVGATLEADPVQDQRVLDTLLALGLDLEAITAELEKEGVEKFSASYRSALESLAMKSSG